MEQVILQKHLQFEILKAVSTSAMTMDEFKFEILRILNEEMMIGSLKFFDYQIGHYGAERSIAPNPVMLNMPEAFWDDEWMNHYYKTFLYNPNHRSVEAKLHNEAKDYCIMKITDLMTFPEYESSTNFREVVQPSGYYYSLVIYFRDGQKLISSIAMARSYEEGDFTDEEILILDRICPYINKRLVEFDRARVASGFQRMMEDVLDISGNAMLMLDDKLNLIAANQHAKEICPQLIGVGGNALADTVAMVARRYRFREDYFTVNAKDGMAYDLSISPYYSAGVASGAVAYLVTVCPQSREAATHQKLARRQDLGLTDRQKQIIECIAAGKTNREIADEMFISENTVRKHVENIRVKLGAKNRIAILKQLDLLAS